MEGSKRQEFAELVQRVILELQADAVPKPVWFVLEDEDASTAVYLVTFADVLKETALASGTPLRDLDGLTREDVRDAVLDAVANPVWPKRGGRPLACPVSVAKLVVAKELPLHFHVALMLSNRVIFLP